MLLVARINWLMFYNAFISFNKCNYKLEFYSCIRNKIIIIPLLMQKENKI